MISNGSNLDRLALTAGAIVQNCEVKLATTPHRHLRVVADSELVLAAQVAAEALQVELLAPIEDEAPKHQATNARGALFQCALAAGDIGELIGTEGWDQKALIKRYQRIEGCLHSVLNFLERAHRLDRREVGGDYFANRSYIPEIWRRKKRKPRARRIATPRAPAA